MKIAVLKERVPGEKRVAVTPETAKLFINSGFTIACEQGLGLNANFNDNNYTQAGAVISNTLSEILKDSDIILKVQPTPTDHLIDELKLLKPRACIIGLLSPYTNRALIKLYAEHKLSSIALELLPRITKTQSMDALSSQYNLAGYRAIIEAVYHFNSSCPMMMTAAGTITPAKVLIIGTGVAGLQAIATAKRLGAIVSAYDVRSITKEQVESLGAKFIELKTSQNFESASGYANELTNDYKLEQKKLLTEHVCKNDIIITTAQIPGQRAPLLISQEMITAMKSGSVVVDMSTNTGGNVEGAIKDQIIEINMVKIIGFSNLSARIATDSSKLYAKNLYNLVTYLFKNKTEFNIDNDIIKPMLLTHNGQIVHENFKE
jgi:NAD(P) transhydrogenase subunit alpha